MSYVDQEQLLYESNIKEEIAEDTIFYKVQFILNNNNLLKINNINLIKIANISVCYYCASTEARFIEEQNMMHLYSPNTILES